MTGAPREGGSDRVARMRGAAGGNATVVINALVGVIVTRYAVVQLGVEGYGTIGLTIALGLLATTTGNALSGAAARFVTQALTRQDRDGVSAYLSASAALVILAGVVATALGTGYVALLEGPPPGLTVGFASVVLLSLSLSALAGVFSAGLFATGRLATRAAINGAERLLYGTVSVALLVATSLGIWSIAIGLAAGALLRTGLSFAFLGRTIPEAEVGVRHIRWTAVREVAGMVGWMSLAYLGGFILRSGTMIAVERTASAFDLGRYAIMVQVTGLAVQSLQAVGVVAAPVIYSHLAKGANASAQQVLQRYWALIVKLGLAWTVAVAFVGQSVVDVWLGSRSPADMTVLLVGGTLWATMDGVTAVLSVFLAGIPRLSAYGSWMFVESFIVIGGVILILSLSGGTAVGLVVYLAPVFAAIRNFGGGPLMAGRSWVRIPGAIRRHFADIALLVLGTAALGAITGWTPLASGGFIATGARVAILGIPQLVFFWTGYLRRR